MIEVKKQPEILGQGKREVMKWFKAYVEDFNTATLPHEKYYNFDAWEMKEYHQQKRKTAQHVILAASSYEPSLHSLRCPIVCLSSC
jgi:hypothetical protein